MREKEFSSEPSGFEAGFCESKAPIYSASGLTRLLLALIALYIVFASLAVYLLEVRNFRSFNLYYLALVAACALLALGSLGEVSFHLGTIKRRNWIRPLALLGFGLVAWAVYRFPHLFANSLWIDEITQFQGDWNLPRTMADPAIFAANQQQPPVDYYLSAFARIVLGTTEFAVQVHSVLFGILSLVLFLVWLAQIGFPVALAPVPVVLFAAHHTLLRFSSEARPISLAVFFSMTTLIFLFESVQRKKTSARALGVSALLLLYSTGLQPIFFLCALSVGVLPLAFLQLGREETAKLLLVLCVGPLILFSPTLWEIYRESARQNQFFDNSFIGAWWGAARALRWRDFNEFLWTIGGAEWLVFIPFIALLIAWIAKAARPRRVPDTMGAWALTGIIFILLFPAAFQVFWIIVNWPKNLYYFVLWPVGIFALAALSLAQLLACFPIGEGKRWRQPTLAVICLAAIFHLQGAYARNHRIRMQNDHSFRPNWHKIERIVQGSANPALVLEIPYGSFGWPPYHSVTGQFYEKPPEIRVVRLEVSSRRNFGIPPFRIQETIGGLDQKSDLFYLITLMDDPGSRLGEERKQRILSLLEESSDKVEQIQSGNYLVILRNQDSPSEATKKLFTKLIEADPLGERNFYLADALAAESIRGGSCVGARKWLSVMKISGNFLAANEELKNYLAKKEEDINKLPSCAKK